MSFGAGVKK